MYSLNDIFPSYAPLAGGNKNVKSASSIEIWEMSTCNPMYFT
jgi:hypothetical protein